MGRTARHVRFNCHFAGQSKGIDRQPIVVGHSFGGLLVQNLLGRALAAGAIAINPVPVLGVLELPLSALKSALPVLGKPFNLKRTVPQTEARYRFGFADVLPEAEAWALDERFAMSQPTRCDKSQRGYHPRSLYSHADLCLKMSSGSAAPTLVELFDGSRGPGVREISANNQHIGPST